MKFGSIKNLAAAHLALLAVAPLLLSSFLGSEVVALFTVWLSLPALVWQYLLVPVRPGEFPPEARTRFLRQVRGDLIGWVLVIVILIAFVRVFNGPLVFGYDHAAGEWGLAGAVRSLPSAAVSAFPPLAFAVAAFVVVIGVVHSLDVLGRLAFARFAAVSAAVAAGSLVAMKFGCGMRVDQSVVLADAGGFFALVGAWAFVVSPASEKGWRWLLAVAVAVCASAVVLLAPAFHYLAFVVAISVVSVLAAIRFSVGFPLVMIIAALLPVALLAAVGGVVGDLLPDGAYFAACRESGAAAVSAWREYPWFGTGVGSFDYDLKLKATEATWRAVSANGSAAIDLWRFTLAERGVVGLALALVAVFSLVPRSWRRSAGALPLAGSFTLAVLLAFILLSLFDKSLASGPALLAALSALVLTTETANGQ